MSHKKRYAPILNRIAGAVDGITPRVWALFFQDVADDIAAVPDPLTLGAGSLAGRGTENGDGPAEQITLGSGLVMVDTTLSVQFPPIPPLPPPAPCIVYSDTLLLTNTDILAALNVAGGVYRIDFPNAVVGPTQIAVLYDMVTDLNIADVYVGVPNDVRHSMGYSGSFVMSRSFDSTWSFEDPDRWWGFVQQGQRDQELVDNNGWRMSEIVGLKPNYVLQFPIASATTGGGVNNFLRCSIRYGLLDITTGLYV